jgi:hypothetical protein
MTNLPKATYQDRFEDCVAVKLHFTKLKPVSALSIFRSSKEEIDISMTIRFGQEQVIEIPYFPFFDGKVYFGVRRGTLELTLENCRLPLEKVALDQDLQILIEVESQSEKSIEVQVGVASNLKSVDKESDKIKKMRSRVKQIGGETSPKWIFDSNHGEAVLSGRLLEEKLGTIRVENKPCKVTAIFTVLSEDVWINRGRVGLAEGQTLSASKWAHIERLMALRYIGKNLGVPISEMRWEYV